MNTNNIAAIGQLLRDFPGVQWMHADYPLPWTVPAILEHRADGYDALVTTDDPGSVVGVRWRFPNYLHIDRYLHDDIFVLRSRLPAYDSVIKANASVCIGWAELFYGVATIVVAMTKEDEDADDAPREWRHGWGPLLLPFQRHGLPYVRFTQVGDVGTKAIGQYTLSYP